MADRITEKNSALETALKQIEKSYGKGAIMRLGQNCGLNVEAISTGSLTLDLATGIGGLPRGRIVEIYGPESSGKTTLALHVVAEAQKAGGEAAFIDAEHALDPVYASHLGVDIDSLLVSQPDNGEQALEITEALVRSGALDVVVVDSVAARLMSQALRKLAGAISKSNTILIFINQLREKVGVMYGNPEVTTGGRALKYYASMRIDVRKADQLKGANGEFIGSHTKVKIVKNKVAPPFKTAEFDIMFGKGIAIEGEILDLAVSFDIIHKSGAWFSYNDERLGQGRDNVKEMLRTNKALREEVETKVRAKFAEATEAKKASANELEDMPAAPAPVVAPPAPKGKIKANLDIAVDDDE